MFHFTGYRALFLILFRKRRWSINSTGLPHSEISGSKRMCRSPKLIAACHVLHRLLAPRHPLCALKSLIPCLETSCHMGGVRITPGPPLHNGPAEAGPCRKNLAFGNLNISKDLKNGSRNFFRIHTISLQSIKSYFSPYGCQRADSVVGVRQTFLHGKKWWA